jgi:hypothetical protein
MGSPVFVDISGFLMIKIVLASIDALVEKEVIPEVSEELSCTRALVDLNKRPFFVFNRAYTMTARFEQVENQSGPLSGNPPAVTSHA